MTRSTLGRLADLVGPSVSHGGRHPAMRQVRGELQEGILMGVSTCFVAAQVPMCIDIDPP
jgi:hypothetical protein